MGIAAMIACSFQAVFQTDVRRTLAYSSVAQVGYMLLGVSIGTAAGVSAGMFHLVNHALIKGSLFMALAGVVLTYQGTSLNDFKGLGSKRTMDDDGVRDWRCFIDRCAAHGRVPIEICTGYGSVPSMVGGGQWLS